MKLRFRPEDIEACDSVMAADEGKQSMEDVVSDKLDALEDDFGYAVAGLEKMCRDGQFEAAMRIINTLSESLDTTISDIGGSIESEE